MRCVGAAWSRAGPGVLLLAGSVLKRVYRGLLLAEAPGALFVFLDGPTELLEQRLEHPHDHFMASDMLDSQLDTLEPLAADEPGVTVSIAATPSDIVADIRSKLSAL